MRSDVTRPLGAAALLATIVACAAVPSQRASFREPTDVARLTRSAAGVTGLEIQGGAADVNVVAIQSDSIDVSVALRSQDAERLTGICVPRAELKAEPDGARIVVFLDQHSRDRCGEVWAVRVPASIPVVIRTTVGKVTTAGLAAGLTVRITSTGSIDAKIDGGPIDARVEVGDVKVTSNARAYRRVRLRSNVGRVTFVSAGMRVSPAREGAGSTFEADGRGEHEAKLHAGVGDVELVVGVREP